MEDDLCQIQFVYNEDFHHEGLSCKDNQQRLGNILAQTFHTIFITTVLYINK